MHPLQLLCFYAFYLQRKIWLLLFNPRPNLLSITVLESSSGTDGFRLIQRHFLMLISVTSQEHSCILWNSKTYRAMIDLSFKAQLHFIYRHDSSAIRPSGDANSIPSSVRWIPVFDLAIEYIIYIINIES